MAKKPPTFATEKELKAYVSERMKKIKQLFKEATRAEAAFYGYSPSDQAAKTLTAKHEKGH